MCYIKINKLEKSPVMANEEIQVEEFMSYQRELIQRSLTQLELYKTMTQQQNELINVQVNIIKLHGDLLDMQDIIIEAYRTKRSDKLIQMMIDQLNFQKTQIKELKQNYQYMKSLLVLNQNVINNNQRDLEDDIEDSI